MDDVGIAAGIIAGVCVVGLIFFKVAKFMLTDKGGFGGGP